MIRERPILFSSPMVRSLLEDRKTQTRRVINPQPPSIEQVTKKSGAGYSWMPPDRITPYFRVAGPVWAVRELMGERPELRCPYGVPGDRLWVRETWQESDSGPELYAADYESKEQAGVERWRPSIYMPRLACRIVLELTGVRVERLQAITEDDSRAEGVECGSQSEGMFTARHAYAKLWDDINGKRAPWESSPWVWVLSFRRLSTAEAKGANSEGRRAP